MDILTYFNDIIQSTIILLIIIYGTKLVNYYYNFYHIYTYLDYEQKLGYFKSNNLVNLISKYVFIKKIIVYYILIPIIKFNYLFISLFITLLYSLCYTEFKKILIEQQKTKYKNKKNKKKTYDFIISESSNDITTKQVNNDTNNEDNSNINNDLSNINNDLSNIDSNLTCYTDFTNKNISQNNSNSSYDDNNSQNDIELEKNDIGLKKNIINEKKNLNKEIFNVDNIGIDYDNGILNIIEFMSDTNLNNTNLNNTNLNNTTNNIEKNDINESQLKLNDKFNSKVLNTNDELNKNNNKFNLLDEIDLLKLNNKLINNNIDKENLNDYINDDNDYINDDNNNLKNNISNNLDNDINEYLIIDNKIKNISETLNIKENLINNDNLIIPQVKDYGETINFDDIDFGIKIENLNTFLNGTKNVQNINMENKTENKTENKQNKKIIKIGKKKNN